MRPRDIFKLTAFLALVTAVTWFGFFHDGPELRRFNQFTDENQLIGKSREQVLQFAGQPESTATIDASGGEQLTYAGPYGHYCRIILMNGRVVTVSKWTK